MMHGCEYCETKRTCREFPATYMVDNCGLGRCSHEDDLLYIFDTKEKCDQDVNYCHPKSPTNWLLRSKLKYIFPTLVCGNEVSSICYLLFLGISTFTILETFRPAYLFTNALEKEFVLREFQSVFDTEKEFREMSTLWDFWEFLDVVLFESRYWNYWYSRNNLNDSDKKYIENYLLGVPRLAEIHVNPNKCLYHSKNAANMKCFAQYSHSEEDRHIYKMNNIYQYNCTNFDMTYFVGLVDIYTGCGYSQDLMLKRNEVKTLIDSIKEDVWVSRPTRAVILTFTVYNPNINFFCVVNFIFERPPTGGIISSRKLYTVRLLPYVTLFDHIVLGFQIVFVFFIIYFTIKEILKIILCGRKYWFLFWNYITLTLLILSIICIIMYIILILLARWKIKQQRENPNSYVGFTRIAFYFTQLNCYSGVVIFLIWIKIFQYVQYYYPLNILNATLSRNKKILCGFSVCFGLVFIAFGLLGYIWFGGHAESFSTYGTSFFTLMRTIMGDFVYDEIKDTELGSIFFIGFIVLVFFILINMLIVLIGDNFNQAVKFGKCSEQKFSTKLDGMIFTSKCCRRLKKKKKKRKKQETNILRFLKTCGYKEEDVLKVFEHCHISQCMDVSKSRIKQFMVELLTNKYEFYEAAEFIRHKHSNLVYFTVDEYEQQDVELARLAKNIEVIDYRIKYLLQDNE